MKVTELPCTDHRASFYGKAHILNWGKGTACLKSYDTIVASVDRKGNFRRHWPGYSVTTMRHVNSFLDFFNLEGGGKAWWEKQPVKPLKW